MASVAFFETHSHDLASVPRNQIGALLHLPALSQAADSVAQLFYQCDYSFGSAVTVSFTPEY